jgi:ADP-ribose pyrophosphatase YjhB (NUDIX family)
MGVGAIVIRNGAVLLVRSTYGSSNGKLMNPGGFVHKGEMPYDAVRREVLEETGVVCEPAGMLALRCDPGNWYLVFLCDYIGGEPVPDGEESSEALFLDCAAALSSAELTETAKTLIEIALKGKVLPLQPLNKGRVMFSTDVTDSTYCDKFHAENPI